MIRRRSFRLLAQAVYTPCFVLLFAIAGKCCQYAGVLLLSDKAGFEGGSAIGLAPFVALLILAKSRYSRWFDWRVR